MTDTAKLRSLADACERFSKGGPRFFIGEQETVFINAAMELRLLADERDTLRAEVEVLRPWSENDQKWDNEIKSLRAELQAARERVEKLEEALEDISLTGRVWPTFGERCVNKARAALEPAKESGK